MSGRRPELTAALVIGLLALGVPAVAQLPCGAARVIPTGPAPYEVTVGDLEPDGDVDLVVVDRQEHVLDILFNDGAAMFSPAPGSPLALPPVPVSAALGSFDVGDVTPTPDLVTLAHHVRTPGRVGVHLGDGAGRFVTSADFEVGDMGTTGHKIVVADFDGDGYEDLAFSNGAIRLGRGDGTFTEAPPVPIELYGADVLTADWNHDGDPDLAFAHFFSRSVLIFLGGPGATFSPAPGSPVVLGVRSAGLAAGDFDGDGALDLAVTADEGPDPRVLLGDGSGNLAALPPQVVPVSTDYGRGVAAGDLDGDGLDDLIVTGHDGTAILLAVGGGTFQEPPCSPLAVPTEAAAGSPRIADFDGDGWPDIAVVSFGDDGVVLHLSGDLPARPRIDPLPGGGNGQRRRLRVPEGGIDWTDPDPETRRALMDDECLDVRTDGFDTRCMPWHDADLVIRTEEEWRFWLECPDARTLPPVPGAGEVLLVSTRAWAGCSGCVRFRCVVERDDGLLVAFLNADRGSGDCDALGLAGAWALVPETSRGAGFVEVGPDCR